MIRLSQKEDVANDVLDLKISTHEEHIAQCQRLRYKVYCVERGWYNEVQIRKGHEYDRFDERSGHALLSRSDNGESIGVVRLVLPSGDPLNPDLPIQELEPSPLLQIDQNIDFTKIAEVSRFSVTQDYNRRIANGGPKADKNERRLSAGLSIVSVKLLRAIVVMARENDIRYLCATMEPSLLMLMARLGFKSTALGEPRSYHGLRQPCFTDLEEVNRHMREVRPEAHDFIFGE